MEGAVRCVVRRCYPELRSCQAVSARKEIREIREIREKRRLCGEERFKVEDESALFPASIGYPCYHQSDCDSPSHGNLHRLQRLIQ